MQTKLNILVTGGAGYIGSHIVQLLCEQDQKVIVYDNLSLGRRENIHPKAELVVGDIQDKGKLSKVLSGEIDIVFHFAAWKAAGESMTDPGKYATNNIAGTINLLNCMLENKVQFFIFSSSAAVYGDPQYLPIDEKHPKQPTNYYGYSKLAIEENLAWYSRLKNIRYAALRYFNATGYDVKGIIRGQENNPANLCPVVMEAACGMRSSMQVFGNDYDTPDGTGVRDYIHVSDLADAHLLAMEYLMRERRNLVVNLGTGEGQSVLDMIGMAEKITGKKVNYKIVGRREGDPPKLWASSELAAKKLGWKAKYSDLETIFKTMYPVYFGK
jgi:UDP-glucose 4-epimerase